MMLLVQTSITPGELQPDLTTAPERARYRRAPVVQYREKSLPQRLIEDECAKPVQLTPLFIFDLLREGDWDIYHDALLCTLANQGRLVIRQYIETR